MTTKHINLAVVYGLVVVVAYLLWAAVGSTACTTAGLNEKTRISWSVATGCVKEGNPFDAYQFKESR